MHERDKLIKQQLLLADFGEFALRSQNLDEVLTKACQLVADALETGRAKVLQIEHDKNCLFVRAGVGWDEGTVGHLRLPLSEHSSETFSINAGRPVLTNDIRTETRFEFPHFLKDAGIIAIANVPVYLPGGRPFGLLQVDATEPRRFGDEDVQFLRTYSTLLGPVLDRLLRLADLNATAARLRALADASTDAFFVMTPDWTQMQTLSGGTFLRAPPSPSRDWLNDYIPLQEQERIRERIQSAIERKVALMLEHRVMRANGSQGWALSRAVPIFASDGSITEWFGSTSDVTKRKLAEARQAFLLTLSDTLRPVRDPEDVKRKATELLQDHLGTSRAEYIEVREESGEFVVTRYWRHPHEVRSTGRYSVQEWPSPLLADGQTLVVNNIDEDPRFPVEQRRSYRDAGARALVVVPLIKEMKFVATLMTSQEQPRCWKADEVALIEDVAERSWAAVERAWAEKLMRESEERLRLIVETARDYAIMTLDPDGHILDWYAGAEAIFGYASEEIRGVDGAILFTPEDRAAGAPKRELEIARAQGSATDLRWHTRKGGDRVFIDGITLPLFGPEKNLRGYLKIGQNVTERRAREVQLTESESRFRQFGEASSDVIWIRSADTLQFEYVSPAFERIYGIPLGELASSDNLERWASCIVADERAHVLSNLQNVRRGERITHEYRIRRPDGDIRWIRDTDFPLFDEYGRVQRVAGIGQDVTALKQAREDIANNAYWVSTLLDGIPQLVWRSSGEGAWTWASTQWVNFTGQSRDDSKGFGWLGAVHPDDHADVLHKWKEAGSQGEFALEYRIRRATDEMWVWHHTRASAVRDSRGQILEWLGTSTDISDLRRLQEQQGVLVAELQHRTRNLIAVIRSLAERTLAKTGNLDEFRERFRERLAALARVQGLLAQKDTGQRVSFDELLNTELSGLGALDGHSDKVNLAGPPNVALRSPMVQTLALALHELATNAVKYGALSAPDGHLDVRWRIDDEGTSKARLRVEWIESGVTTGSEANAPARRGFGRDLIERALPYQLLADTDYELRPDGVRCTISLPLAPAI